MPEAVMWREPRKQRHSNLLLSQCPFFLPQWPWYALHSWFLLTYASFPLRSLSVSLSSIRRPVLCPPFSLSGCPLADKSLRSLMAANTPELKYVCSHTSTACFTATSLHCYWHRPPPQRFNLLMLTYLLLLAATAVAAAAAALLHLSWCVLFSAVSLNCARFHFNQLM